MYMAWPGTMLVQLVTGIKKAGPRGGTHRFLGFLRPLRGRTHRFLAAETVVTWWFHGGYVPRGTRTSDRDVEGVGGQVDSDQAALHRGGDKQLGLICGLETTQAVPDRSAGRPTAEPRW